MFPKIAFICCVISFSLNTHAQQLLERDSIQYDLHISGTAILSGGNLERVVSQNRLIGNIESKHIQFVTENSYRYGRNFTRVVENDVLTRNYARFLSGKKIYAFVIGTFENNFKRSIKKRWQLGAGGAYNFYQKNRDFLRISIAVAHEQTRYAADTFNLSGYNGQSKIKETRGFLRFGGMHNVLQNHLVLRHDTWFMAGLSNKNNYRWHSLLGFQLPLFKGLAFKTDYEYTYESLAIRYKNPFGFPSRTFDWVLTFGFSYDMSNRTRR